jgi:3-(3-hydroxy-phenyl)propionate hydroxylase
MDQLGGGFQILAFNCTAPERLEVDGIEVSTLSIAAPSPEMRSRYLGEEKAAVYLMRPDQHVAARWTAFDENSVRAAVTRAVGRA